jgi:hypothetical protein
MDVGECQRGRFRARLHSGRKVVIPPSAAKDRNRKRQVNQNQNQNQIRCKLGDTVRNQGACLVVQPTDAVSCYLFFSRATLCLSCYSPGWWEASARGGMSLKIEAGEWLSKAKHKNSRRR